MAIDASVGGAASDSYADVAYSDAYHAARGFNSEYLAATTPVKEAALKWATRLLERLEWCGYKKDIAQALRWPRVYVYDQDGYWYESTIVPVPVKNAACELALYLIKEDRTADSGAIPLNSLSVGSLSMSFDTGAQTKEIPDGVKSMIAFLLENGGSKTMRKVVRA